MASYAGNKQSKAEHDRLSDGNWTDILQEDDLNCASGAQSVTCCDYEDHQHLVYGADHNSDCVVSHSPPYLNSSHHPRHTACLMKPNDDSDDDDDDDDAHIHYWHAGTALPTLVSRTSETNQLFGNDITLVTNADISCCGQDLTDHSVTGAQYSSTDDSDLGLNDCPSLRGKIRSSGCSSLPADELLVLDDDPLTSFLPSLAKLRQKIHCLDNECGEELRPTSWRRKDRPKAKSHSKSSRLCTWSEFSSSDESDNHWYRTEPDHGHRQCSGSRRLKSIGRCSEDLRARSCSVEPGCCSADKLVVDHYSSNRRRRKKTSSLTDEKLLNDLFLPHQASLTGEQTTWHQDGTSLTDCLADVSSNATDSENTGHVSDIEEDYNDFDNTVINDNTSSSVMAPLACSFHCIPPENGEKQAARLTASSVDCSPLSSPDCDKDNHGSSSEGELCATLDNVRISDPDSCHSSRSFGEKEDNIDMNVSNSEWDRELTSAALCTAAVSAAAAAAAAAHDDGDDASDGWQMCDVETRILPPEWYSYRNGDRSSLNDYDDDDDDDADGLHLMDSDADDEFECDCPVCLMQQQHISDSWQDSERLLPMTAGSLTNYVPAGLSDDDDNGGDEPNLVSFSFTAPDYNSALSEGVTINSIFQDVVIQMLQYYPNLLTNETPPPLTDAEFSRLPSLTISLAAHGEESSCSICLCRFEESEDAKILPCHHMFHTLCIQTWLNKAGTCPVCRQSVVVNASAADASRHGNDDDDDDTAQHS